MRIGAIGSKAEYTKSTIAINPTASSVAKKTRDLSIANANRIYSNRRSWKDKCSNNMPKSAGRIYILAISIYYEGK